MARCSSPAVSTQLAHRSVRSSCSRRGTERYALRVKRLVLVAFVAACGASSPRTPFEKNARRQLAGDATIERSRFFRDKYDAYRDERMDFELDADGNLTRTEIT